MTPEELGELVEEGAELEKNGKEKQIERGFPAAHIAGHSQPAQDFLKWRRKESQF